jgi:hypothetical protein
VIVNVNDAATSGVPPRTHSALAHGEAILIVLCVVLATLIAALDQTYRPRCRRSVANSATPGSSPGW